MKLSLAVPLLVFLIAVVSCALQRSVLPPRLSTAVSASPSGLLKLIVLARAADDWNAMAWNAVRAACEPRAIHFGIFVECAAIEEAEAELDAVLRSHARVDYDVLTSRPHPRRVARAVRRFVTGDETAVVVLHRKSALLPRWDETVLRLAAQLDETTVASAPPRVREEARFPTLRQKSDGRVAREASLSFKGQGAVLVPSVCWCPEVVFATPAAFKKWPASDEMVDDPSRRHVVPAVALLEENRELEDEMLDDDANCSAAERRVRRCETVGITTAPTEAEMTLKYGSVRAAKMAVKFGAA